MSSHFWEKACVYFFLSGYRFHIAIENQAWYNVKVFMTKYNVPCFCHPAGHRVAARCLSFFLLCVIVKEQLGITPKSSFQNLCCKVYFGSWSL